MVDTDSGLKIIAKYLICFTCDGTGEVDDEPCDDCGGLGWEHSDGLELAELGALVDVRKFRPPDDPIQQEDYRAD